MKLKNKFLLAFIITIVYFLIHLAIINDYAVSWDFHYHHYAGLFHLGLPVPSIQDNPKAPFTPPDPRLTVEDPFGPIIQILPTLSYLALFEKLHLFPFDSAYNLPMVMIGSLGIGLLFLFMYDAVGITAAFISALFLMLLPVHFGYIHNNMKDVPNAFMYALSIYLFWKLSVNRNIKNLTLAVVGFAIAFNTKINSIFIPVINLFWFCISYFREISIGKNFFPAFKKKKLYFIILYFIFSPIVAIAFWWPFWKNPLGKLLELPYFFSHNTLNMPILFLGNIYHSGIDVPWIYPYVYIVITTPIPILIFFIIGSIYCLVQITGKEKIYSLLFFWFMIPILRYFNPRGGAIDGVRHFMEVIYPLSAIAGIGFVIVYNQAIKYVWKPLLIGIGFIVILILVRNIIIFHPYQTSFFNALTGGIKGAWGKFDIDFWGNPQKKAMYWLNKNAPESSKIYIAMAQSSAGLYLRPDLSSGINSRKISNSDYVVILNRESYLTAYGWNDVINQKNREKKLVYKISIDEVPLVWIFQR